LISRLTKAWRAARSAFTNRTLENPSTPLDDPDDWLYDALGAAPSSSGMRVSHESALKYAPLWRGINLISRDVAKLPLFVYKRNGDGKDRANDHPAYTLLRYKPNAEMIAFPFWQTLVGHVLTRGNGYAYIFRLGSGVANELIPLNPDNTYPVRANGVLTYVTKVNGEDRKLLPENVLHIKGFSFDGLVGYNVIQKARDSLGRGIAAGEYGSRFFRNDAKPSIVLEHPAKLSDQAVRHLRESWSTMHQGVENAHKPAILEEGMKVHAYSINARDAQLLETRAFEIRDVANWLNIPPHKLGDSSRVSYNSLEQENQSYLDDALDPWLVNIEQECRDKLLTEAEKSADTHVIEFMRQAMLRADISARGEFYVKATGGHPWMTVNEVRGLENMNPVDGFDDIQAPTNNFGDAAGGAVPKPKPKGGNDAAKADAETNSAAMKAMRAVLVDATRRMAKRLVTHAKKAAKTPETLTAWLDVGLAADHRATLLEAMSPALAVCATTLDVPIDPQGVVDQMLLDFRTDLTNAGAAGVESILSTYETGVPDVIAGRVFGD
jgi:HK97 family phage portal protein